MDKTVRSSARRYWIAVATLLLVGGTAGLVAATDEPSSESLRSDIERVQANIDQARRESEQYSGGLIKGQIGVRIALLETTKAMLEQKQSSLLRRISLTYGVDAKAAGCLDPSQMSGIDAEIAAAKERVEAAKLEALRYSGGVILALIEVRKAQEELTLATLESAKIAARYGIPFVSLRDVTPESPPQPVDKSHDKDAL